MSFDISGISFLGFALLVLGFGIGIAGIVGAIQIAMTRDDAFTAADRLEKWIWFCLVAGSTVAVIQPMFLIKVIGMVILGIYWFDVRPQIKDILGGSSAASW